VSLHLFGNFTELLCTSLTTWLELHPRTDTLRTGVGCHQNVAVLVTSTEASGLDGTTESVVAWQYSTFGSLHMRVPVPVWPTWQISTWQLISSGRRSRYRPRDPHALQAMSVEENEAIYLAVILSFNLSDLLGLLELRSCTANSGDIKQKPPSCEGGSSGSLPRLGKRLLRETDLALW
jgi:hypothetical protein